MVWSRLAEYENILDTGVFAIVFFLHTEWSLALYDFSRFLLHFTYANQPHPAHPAVPPILRIGYVIHPFAVSSVLVCGTSICHEYEALQDMVLSGVTPPVGGCVVTTWPPDEIGFRQRMNVCIAVDATA